MDKIVPNNNSRRRSTGNFTIQPTTYKVLSRYHKDPLPDNCKTSDFRTQNDPITATETSSINKLLNKVPKPSTKDAKITNTSLPKIRIKPQPTEPKKQDPLKSKSNGEINDPFYMPPLKTLTRRFSEVLIPSTGLGDVLVSPPDASTKSSKKFSNSKEANSVKTNSTAKPSGNGKILKNAQIFKHEKGLTKLKVDEEVVQKKSDQTNKGGILLPSRKDEICKSESQNNEAKTPESGQHGRTSSPKKDATPRSNSQENKEKVLKNGQIGRISLPLKKDESPQSNSRNIEDKILENSQNGEILSPLQKDATSQSNSEDYNGKIVKTDENECISSPQSNGQDNEGDIEENHPNGEISSPLKKNVSPQSNSQNNECKIAENDQNGEISSPLTKDVTPRSNSHNNESKILERSRSIGTLWVKVKENSLNQKFRFKQGSISNPQSSSSTPRNLEFEQRNQNQDEKVTLRRLVSDSELQSPESKSIKAVRQPCFLEANKRHSGLNNVIEETASRLIETRKSKVKALVGAFEMISTMDSKA